MTNLRKTKLVVTLGPSTDPPGVLERMLAAGVDAVRLNMSHGVHEDHRRRVERLRRLAVRAGRHVPVMVDLSGPKIRVGQLPPEGLELVRGTTVRLVSGERVPAARRGSAPTIPVPVRGLIEQARRGRPFLLKDGLLRLRTLRVSADGVLCQVEEGGVLRSRQGIALPGARLPQPSLTAKDRRDLRFGLAIRADFFALSFVRSVRDVRQATRLACGVPLLAKIERPEALEELDAIIRESAGVMVARGDLGVELGPERVPLVQKRLLREANAQGRIAILATQMLASMEESPIPTRAEAADVANAVLDGADALLLTGETAGGKHPVEAVCVLGGIVDEVERSELYRTLPRQALTVPDSPEEALASAAVNAAGQQCLAALVVLSRSGQTAALLSDHRPGVPIVALAEDAAAARRLALQWGVLPGLRRPRSEHDVTRGIAIARRLLGLRQPAWFGVCHGDPDGARHLTLARG